MTGMTSQKFYTECVSYSRACYLPFMANQWAASTKWPYEKDGYAHCEKMLDSQSVDVYIDQDTTNDHESFSGYSFKSDTT